MAGRQNIDQMRTKGVYFNSILTVYTLTVRLMQWLQAYNCDSKSCVTNVLSRHLLWGIPHKMSSFPFPAVKTISFDFPTLNLAHILKNSTTSTNAQLTQD